MLIKMGKNKNTIPHVEAGWSEEQEEGGGVYLPVQQHAALKNIRGVVRYREGTHARHSTA